MSCRSVTACPSRLAVLRDLRLVVTRGREFVPDRLEGVLVLKESLLKGLLLGTGYGSGIGKLAAETLEGAALIHEFQHRGEELPRFF